MQPQTSISSSFQPFSCLGCSATKTAEQNKGEKGVERNAWKRLANHIFLHHVSLVGNHSESAERVGIGSQALR